MTTPPGIGPDLPLLVLSLPVTLWWAVRVRRRTRYNRRQRRRRLVATAVGTFAASLLTLYTALRFGFIFGFGWSDTFGDGYGPALPFVVAGVASVALLLVAFESLVSARQTTA